VTFDSFTTGCLYNFRQLAKTVSLSIPQVPFFQSLTDGTVIAITGVGEDPHGDQNSRERMDAEDHEGSEWRSGL
jgi:hypothetical protein